MLIDFFILQFMSSVGKKRSIIYVSFGNSVVVCLKSMNKEVWKLYNKYKKREVSHEIEFYLFKNP